MNDIISIQLDKQAAVPLYVQLYEALRSLIVEGKLGEGYKLPPIRKLANSLRVNTVTVVNAYKLLEQNGYIHSRTGSGSFVAGLSAQEEDDWKESVPLSAEDFGLVEQGQVQSDTHTINFASATPTPELFPVEDFKEVLNEVLERDKGYAFGYQESQGFYPLRESVCDYLKEHGIASSPENIQIISGAQQGIDILTKALLNFGDCIFTESPTYTGAIAAFRSRGAKIVEISLEPDGLDMAELEDKLRRFRPKFIYVMPKLQNPTGYTYSIPKRQKLLQLAKRFDTIIIEDDYLGELDFSGTDLAPLKALDRENRVIYIKSFSKIFMPGLRLAFLVVPQNLQAGILAAKLGADISTSGLTQRAFDLYLRKGIWQKHISYMRQIYEERYNVMTTALQKTMPQTVSYHLPQGGLTIWLTLPPGISAQRVCDEAGKKNVLVVPGALFFPRQKPDSFLRISFAAAYPEEIRQGMKTLGKIIQESACQPPAQI